MSYYNGTTTVTASPVVSVSNEQFEFEENAKKARIQIIKPQLIEDFVENNKTENAPLWKSFANIKEIKFIILLFN